MFTCSLTTLKRNASRWTCSVLQARECICRAAAMSLFAVTNSVSVETKIQIIFLSRSLFTSELYAHRKWSNKIEAGVSKLRAPPRLLSRVNPAGVC